MFSLKVPEFTLTEKSLLGLAKGHEFCSVGDKAQLYGMIVDVSDVTLPGALCDLLRYRYCPVRSCTDEADDCQLAVCGLSRKLGGFFV